MENPKNYLSLILVVLLYSCSSTPTITQTSVPVTIPAIKDSIVLRDSVIYKDSVLVDSLWFGEVSDSLGNVIGDLKVYFKKKIAELKLNERQDTVYVTDTVKVSSGSNSIVPIIYNSLTWWEQALLTFGSTALLGLIIWLRLKRGKVI